MPEHVDIESANAHEPKHITTAGTADAGKVITPSDTTAGTSELRLLTESEISEKQEYFSFHFVGINTTKTEYMVMPFAGTLTRVDAVVPVDLAGSATTLTVAIDGVDVNPATISLATGQGAGYAQNVQPTSLNTFSAGDHIEITTDGGTSTNTHAMITLTVSRS